MLAQSLRRSIAIAVPAIATAFTGCAAFERMNQERLDRAVTVSAQAPLYEYRRIGVEAMRCTGALCDSINTVELMRQVRQTLTGACYEVVDDSELRRYYEYFAHASGMTLMDFGFAKAGMPGFKMNMLDPMMQQVVMEELDLEGMIKASIDIGQPDSVNGFRTAIIDLELVDAHGRQVLWHGRLDGNITQDSDADRSVQYLATEISGQIVKKASACGQAPPSPIVVQQGLLDLPDRIYFELGSAQISERSHSLLGDLAYWFQQHPEVTFVEIEGHTDDIGDDRGNLLLSEQRAQAVHQYLTSKGVDARRISPKGYGESRPIVANDNPVNRSTNRRVEFRVVR